MDELPITPARVRTLFIDEFQTEAISTSDIIKAMKLERYQNMCRYITQINEYLEKHPRLEQSILLSGDPMLTGPEFSIVIDKFRNAGWIFDIDVMTAKDRQHPDDRSLDQVYSTLIKAKIPEETIAP